MIEAVLCKVLGAVIDEDKLARLLIGGNVDLQLAELGLDLGNNRGRANIHAAIAVRERAGREETGSKLGDLIGSRVDLADVGTVGNLLAFPECQKLHPRRPLQRELPRERTARPLRDSDRARTTWPTYRATVG